MFWLWHFDKSFDKLDFIAVIAEDSCMHGSDEISNWMMYSQELWIKECSKSKLQGIVHPGCQYISVSEKKIPDNYQLSISKQYSLILKQGGPEVQNITTQQKDPTFQKTQQNTKWNIESDLRKHDVSKSTTTKPKSFQKTRFFRKYIKKTGNTTTEQKSFSVNNYIQKTHLFKKKKTLCGVFQDVMLFLLLFWFGVVFTELLVGYVSISKTHIFKRTDVDNLMQIKISLCLSLNMYIYTYQYWMMAKTFCSSGLLLRVPSDFQCSRGKRYNYKIQLWQIYPCSINMATNHIYIAINNLSP